MQVSITIVKKKVWQRRIIIILHLRFARADVASSKVVERLFNDWPYGPDW